MKIGVAGPATLPMLADHVVSGSELPAGYAFAPMATWIEALMTRGHQVVLFTLAPEAKEPRTFKGDQLTIHVGRYRSRHRARDFFACERQDLLRAMLEDPCDILHAHWTYEFALAALDSGRPALVTAHDAPLRILRFTPDPYRFVRFLMALRVAQRAPYMTAVSDHVASHFRRLLGYKGDIRTIPNSLPDDLFAHASQRDGKQKTSTLTYATVLCGWGKLKNGARAIEAFRRVRQTQPNSKLIMFGNDYGVAESAERWAQANDLVEGIEFAGILPHREMINRLVSEVDVLIHPSREESFSMAIAESMVLGIPAIGGHNAGACSGAPRIRSMWLVGRYKVTKTPCAGYDPTCG